MGAQHYTQDEPSCQASDILCLNPPRKATGVHSSCCFSRAALDLTCMWMDNAPRTAIPSADHARLDPLEERPAGRGGGIGGRRSLHQWWARGDSTDPVRPPSAALQAICKIPPRLCLHENREVREFYSLWSDGQVQWAAAGFPPLRRIDSVDDVDRGGNTAYEFKQ